MYGSAPQFSTALHHSAEFSVTPSLHSSSYTPSSGATSGSTGFNRADGTSMETVRPKSVKLTLAWPKKTTKQQKGTNNKKGTKDGEGNIVSIKQPTRVRFKGVRTSLRCSSP